MNQRVSRSFRRVIASAAVAAAITILSVALGAQVTPPAPKRAPLRPISSVDGRDLYNAYCAQCHGQGGNGDGPAAATLRVPAADLTRLAAKNGGQYNRKGVERFIQGDRPGGVLRSDSRGNPIIDMPDGPDEMPVWGIVFRYMWPDHPAAIRCGNLARYIEQIQEK